MRPETCLWIDVLASGKFVSMCRVHTFQIRQDNVDGSVSFDFRPGIRMLCGTSLVRPDISQFQSLNHMLAQCGICLRDLQHPSGTYRGLIAPAGQAGRLNVLRSIEGVLQAERLMASRSVALPQLPFCHVQ